MIDINSRSLQINAFQVWVIDINSRLLHVNVFPVWVVHIWDVVSFQGCVCGSNDGTVARYPFSFPKPNAGAAECVNAQPEIIGSKA